MKFLRSNRGGDFISNEFNILCNDKGIKRQMLALRTPRHTEIVERRNRLVMDCDRTLIVEKNMSQKYWREAISTKIYSLNQVKVKKGANITPFELWYGYTPNVKYFKVLGSKC